MLVFILLIGGVELYISAVVLQGSLSLILKNIPLFHRLRYKIAFTKVLRLFCCLSSELLKS